MLYLTLHYRPKMSKPNLKAFTVQNARLNALKGVAVRRLRKQQREEAAAHARLSLSSTVLAMSGTRQTTISRAVEAQSEAVRGLLSVEAVKQAETLAKAEKNEPGVFKTLVEASDKLFGWSRADAPHCLIQNNYLTELEPQPIVSCGVGSEPKPAEKTIQSPEQGLKP